MPWWPEDVWAGMRQGVDCSICASAFRSNEHSDLVQETAHSYIHLKKNQSHPGHCCVIFKRHAPELHDLTADELQGFTTDLARLGRALHDIYRPVKLDQLIMGHLCPHLHCHVFPQYPEDDPHANPFIHDRVLELPDTEQLARVQALRHALIIRGAVIRAETSMGHSLSAVGRHEVRPPGFRRLCQARNSSTERAP